MVLFVRHPGVARYPTIAWVPVAFSSSLASSVSTPISILPAPLVDRQPSRAPRGYATHQPRSVSRAVRAEVLASEGLSRYHVHPKRVASSEPSPRRDPGEASHGLREPSTAERKRATNPVRRFSAGHTPSRVRLLQQR